jgi:iron complex transport system substrate-binding protein
MVLGATAVGACGDDDASGATDSAEGDGGTDGGTDGAADFPVTVEHAMGETTIAARPERVVTVGTTEQDHVLALGVVPVGITEWYGEQPFATWPWAQDELGGAEPEVLSTQDGFEYERLAALEPDLIVGTSAGIDETSYELLSQIAPTIAHPEGAPGYFAPWKDQARLIAAALGESEQMDTVIADVEAQFAQARDDHPEFDGVSVAFLQNAFYDGNAIAYQEGLSTDFLTDLGFTIPEVLADFAAETQAEIPLEQLSVLDDADVLLWGTENPEDRTALEAEPIYDALEAVQDGNLVFTDGVTAGAIYFTSPLSLPFALDQLVPAFASTLAGDGPAVIDVLGALGAATSTTTGG